MNLTFLYLFIYLCIIAVITWKSSHSESERDYMNISKQLTGWQSTWTTFASLLSGYNFVLGVTFAYLYGFWYLMAFFGAALAFLMLYFLYKKKLATLQEGHDLFSVGDYFGIQYAASTRVIVNVILCACLFLFLTLQIYVNTGLFSSLLKIGRLTALILTTGIVCVYLAIGGFKTSVKTDIFQGVLILPIILTVLVFPCHYTLGRIPAAFDTSQLGFAIGLALLQFLSLLAQAESFQRVFASKDSLALKRGLAWSFLLVALVAGSIAYLGINFKFAGINIDPSNLFIDGVLKALPRWLGSFLIISLIAAFMGTIDSSAFAFAVLLTRTRNTVSQKAVRETRYFILLGLIMAAFASLYLFSFLSSVFALISLISVIGTAVLISFFFNKTEPKEMNTFLSVGALIYILGLILNFVTENPLTSLIPSVGGLVAFLLLKSFRKMATKYLKNRTIFVAF
jgi:Na+/proline symporter